MAISEVANFPLKVIFIIHFLLIGLSSIGYWTSAGYVFYNAIVMAFLMWGIYQKDSEEPLQLAFVTNGISIFLDIFLLVMGFPSNSGARERFSAAMAIINMIARPFTTVYLGRLIQERTGVVGSGIDSIFPGGRNTSYEDIDRNNVPSQSQPNQAGYDFQSAQQI